MSRSTHRISSFQAANTLICAALIVSSAACYRAPSGASQPAIDTPQQATRELGRRRSFPGIDLVPMGRAAFVIRIHSGMVGDGEPLYVIDGEPVMISPSRGIDWFKPEDIAEIKVVKNPADLAIYGPRGVNGVIVITTKQAAHARSGQ